MIPSLTVDRLFMTTTFRVIAKQTKLIENICLISRPLSSLNPFPKDKISDSSKLKEFADDNLKFYENGRHISKRVENNVGKGEIARYEQFLLFLQCFQKTCTVDM